MPTTIPNGAISGAARADNAHEGYTTPVGSAEEVAWLVTHLQTVVEASPASWVGRGMTLLQLTALHIISARAPVTLTDVAHALGTGSPATSAMVDRLIRIGLVSRAPDPKDRRRVELTIAEHAKTMIGEIDLNTARRLQSVLNDIGSQGRRYLIDVLRDTIRRSAGQPTKRRSSSAVRAANADPGPR
jgi:DNA-binding MarR family transcriptional regulator